MSNGKVVITSSESTIFDKAKKLVDSEYECGVIGKCVVEKDRDLIIWRFKVDDEAIRHARIFMNLGFEYVQRVI